MLMMVMMMTTMMYLLLQFSDLLLVFLDVLLGVSASAVGRVECHLELVDVLF